eukprot:2680911-Rhodomonas_salina.1
MGQVRREEPGVTLGHLPLPKGSFFCFRMKTARPFGTDGSNPGRKSQVRRLHSWAARTARMVPRTTMTVSRIV